MAPLAMGKKAKGGGGGKAKQSSLLGDETYADRIVYMREASRYSCTR